MQVSSFSVAKLRARPGRKWHNYADNVLPAWIAEMDFGVAEPIQAALRQIVDEASYGYEGGSRNSDLAAAFAGHMHTQFGWRPGDGDVLPVADLVQALFAAVSVFAEPGQGVVLQTPIYPPFQNAVRETGRRIVEHPLIDDGSRFLVNTDSLRATLGQAPLLLLCNPHNPTGRVFERRELECIAEAVVEQDLVVVADEVHADLTYPPHAHIPFASIGPEVAQRTITITSATKAYNIPGLRCGLMHFGSSRLRERFRTVFPDRLLGTVNSFGVRATITAWEQCAPWLEQVMQILQQNRARLSSFLATELPEAGYHAPEATFLAWLDCSALQLPLPPQRFFLEHAKVALNDGAEFGEAGKGHVRLNFGTSPAILDEILQRLASAIRSA